MRRAGGDVASIRSEYQRFLTSLEQRQIHDDVRRLANLVLIHLQTLAEVGAARRARSIRLAPILLANLAQTPVQRFPEPPNPVDEPALGRLRQLEVGPFRGFMRQETFDLSRDITLVYGANGTGKSSFCEALEIAMLGSISEAQAKRVDHRSYCNNARLRRHIAPVLTSTNITGGVVGVHPNEDEFRFCFIEKNRLDDFARIAARTPGDQRQLIATLFGVDQFSEFVRGFNATLDENLHIYAVKASQLEQRRLQLATSQQVIQAHPTRQAQFLLQEQQLAHRMWPGETFQTCRNRLLGTPQQQGRLPYVQAKLDSTPPPIYEVTQARLRNLLSEAYGVQELWQIAANQLAARAGDVSYSQLYRAVLELTEGATACPACGTDLAAVNQNPFVRAQAGLLQLGELALLQERELALRTELSNANRSIWDEIRRVLAAALAVCSDALHGSNLPILPTTSAGDWLRAWVDGDQRAWNSLLGLAARIEQWDAEAMPVHAQRSAFVQERASLDVFRIEIAQLDALRTASQQELVLAQRTVAEFDVANHSLIAEVAAEVEIVSYNQRVKAAHDAYLIELQVYLAGLPALLLQGLGDRAKDLYNAFNRGDPPNDLLHALWLPLAENGKIEVEFTGEQGVRYDALVVFSEGHIKCLGLAILLAKNISQGCPVVIFDDVVNAIDDEHRDGIWRTFFENGLLDGKQIIMTSHAEEFLHRIQQELGAERAAQIRRYKFLPHLGEHELRIDTDPPTKNYVLLAQQALAQDEKRDALRHARPALESLTDRIWTWMGRRVDGRIELKFSGPKSPWELNNKCAKLNSSLTRIADQYEGGNPPIN